MSDVFMSQYDLLKYPRTHHLEGSGFQKGDEDLSMVPFADIAGEQIIVEEKCDGANSAVSFAEDESLLLQSRGHYLSGGYREKHFNLLKQWAGVHRNVLYPALGKRYIMFGEWVYAKHTVFYDRLPHYFLEFDIYDREKGIFLDTGSRHLMLEGLPVVSVPVLRKASFKSLAELSDMIGPSNFINEGHLERLRESCLKLGDNVAMRCGETDPTMLMEGLYIKVERGGRVIKRLKYVRRAFLQTVVTSDSHWLMRPIVPNQLAYPLEQIFAPVLPDGVGTIYYE
ncbi:MAG: RNA ligase family protein [Gracilibacteraceae bacterium]|jgi:hypothetical protein|nr:RNA ligase family protein [Gracilibacteraceae bacterium]